MSTSTAITPAQRMQNVKDLLQKYEGEFKKALPQHITAEKMIRLATTAITKNPKLLECTQASLIGSVMQAAQLGLQIDGFTGESYLIPYENKRAGTVECQFIPGYRGLKNLAMRSGMVKKFVARAVFAKDEFEYELGIDEKLVHKPYSGAGSPGEITHFYAYIKNSYDEVEFVVKTKAQIDFVRSKTQGKYNKVWDDFYEEMGLKTIVRALSKQTQLSPEFATAVGLSEQAEVLDKPQKNYSTIINLDNNQEMEAELSETIDTDYENMEEEKQEAEREKSTEKGNAATNATLDALKGKK